LHAWGSQAEGIFSIDMITIRATMRRGSFLLPGYQTAIWRSGRDSGLFTQCRACFLYP